METASGVSFLVPGALNVSVFVDVNEGTVRSIHLSWPNSQALDSGHEKNHPVGHLSKTRRADSGWNFSGAAVLGIEVLALSSFLFLSFPPS